MRNSRRTGPQASATPMATSLVEVRLLGPLEVRRMDEPLALGGRQQRALLAVLVLELGGVVSVERLVEALWDDQPPATAAHAVEVYVSKLRKVLGADVIVRSAGGYLLALPPEHVDAVRFERLFAEGQGALAEDPARAAIRFRQALALWRGAPLADFRYDPFAQAEIVRLEVLRDSVEEASVEAELSLGRGDAVIGLLEQMVARAPLRERPRALLMRALYQAGRQADALAVYQAARRLLVDELGLEPGPELKAAEQAILTQDPELAPALNAAAEPPKVRRWVTVLACDLSTTVTVRLDPEVLDSILHRYAEAISTRVARHGGTVERSGGGLVVAVFGAPVAHEDDALRALRAAVEIVTAASELAEELERDVPVRIPIRVAVDSGEVISRATADRRVTGDVVLATGALHAAAQPGEVVLGDATRRLVAHAARVEPIAGLNPASGGAGVAAWRLLDLNSDAPALPPFLDADLIGRHEELAELKRLYARAVEDCTPVLVSVLGEPGIGKTRLARELAASLDGHARVIFARVHPYGERATFAPLSEIVEQAVGNHSREAILAGISGDTEAGRVADRIAALLGVSGDLVQREEIFWAVRRLLEALARERPLVLIVDDLHWAASTFLDLLEHVAATALGPIQLVCLARTDLLEERPRWGDDGSRLALSSLSPRESEALVGVLARTISLPELECERIVDAAAGNPLFVEQLVAFAAEAGGATAVPPTLESLLASRLDRLGPGERAILEAAAIVGTEFLLPAVRALLPAELGPTVPRQVEALARRDFLAFDPPPAPSTAAARFRHVLLRNAAYRSVPKSRRADLHEQLADWLAEAAVPSPGDDELVAHHLEQAYRYREELGRLDERTATLGAEAARRFAAAGRRAHAQHDHASAADLFMHAVGLLAADDPLRRALLPELGENLFWLGRYAEARSVLADALEGARRSNDRRVEWHAVLVEMSLQAQFAGEGLTSRELERTATEALEFFEGLGDVRGAARAAYLVGDARLMQAHHQDAALALESAIANARIAGDDGLEDSSIGLLTASAMSGPTPVGEAIARAEGYLERASTRMLEQVLLRQLALLYAQRARFGTAREYIARSRVLANEFGSEVGRANLAWYFAATVERSAGNLEGAEAELRQGYEILRGLGEEVWRASAAVGLADVLVSQGRIDEAETLLGGTDATPADHDLELQVSSRLVRARILAARSDLEEAERLVCEALSLLDQTDDVVARANALVHLADVLAASGRADEARQAAVQALSLCEQKGNLVLANEARIALSRC